MKNVPRSPFQPLPKSCYRVSAKGLVLDESRLRFLILREANGRWELPGGGIEHDEDPITALKREMEEEMGIVPSHVDENPLYFLTFMHPSGMQMGAVLYETTLPHLNFTPSHECMDLRFVSREEAHMLPLNGSVKALIKSFNPARHLYKDGLCADGLALAAKSS